MMLFASNIVEGDVDFIFPGDNLPTTLKVLVATYHTPMSVEECNQIIDYIKKGFHLAIILTDKPLNSEIASRLRTFPQVIICEIDQRELIRLLVFKLAKEELGDEGIDSEALNKAYQDFLERLRFKELMRNWLDAMRQHGFFIDFESLTDDTVKAAYFLINMAGNFASFNELLNNSRSLRKLIPHDAVSSICPDFGESKVLSEFNTLARYNFVECRSEGESFKYRILLHPVEERVLEILRNSRGRISYDDLKRFFILRKNLEDPFKKILSLMERKCLIEVSHKAKQIEQVRYIPPSEVSKELENLRGIYESIRGSMLSVDLNKFYVITWKKREWHVFKISDVGEEIESLLSSAFSTSDDSERRSYVAVIRELLSWYKKYCNKLQKAIKYKDKLLIDIDDKIRVMQSKLQSSEVFKWLQIISSRNEAPTILELEEIRSKFRELDSKLFKEIDEDYLLFALRGIVGSENETRLDRDQYLITDLEAIEKEGRMLPWTIANYVPLYLLYNKHIGSFSEEFSQGLRSKVEQLAKLSREISQEVSSIELVFKELERQLTPISNRETPVTTELVYRLLRELTARFRNYAFDYIFGYKLIPQNIVTLKIDEAISFLNSFKSRVMRISIDYVHAFNEKVQDTCNQAKILEEKLREVQELYSFAKTLFERQDVLKVFENLQETLRETLQDLLQKLQVSLELDEHPSSEILSLLSEMIDFCQNASRWLDKAIANLDNIKLQYISELRNNVVGYFEKGRKSLDKLKIVENLLIPESRGEFEVKISALIEFYDGVLETLYAKLRDPLKEVRVPCLADWLASEQVLKKEIIQMVAKVLKKEEAVLLFELIRILSERRKIDLDELYEATTEQIAYEDYLKTLLELKRKGLLRIEISL